MADRLMEHLQGGEAVQQVGGVGGWVVVDLGGRQLWGPGGSIPVSLCARWALVFRYSWRAGLIPWLAPVKPLPLSTPLQFKPEVLAAMFAAADEEETAARQVRAGNG